MTITFNPEIHCGARRKQGGEPCRKSKGHWTDHKGAGRCWLHGGRTPNGVQFARREMRFRAAVDALAGLTLAQIADKLARLAAAGAISVEDPDHEDFLRAVNAFAKAAERAEGTKITLEGRIDFLASIPDHELEEAIAEAERLVNVRREQRS